jgi:hypothetical protein
LQYVSFGSACTVQSCFVAAARNNAALFHPRFACSALLADLRVRNFRSVCLGDAISTRVRRLLWKAFLDSFSFRRAWVRWRSTLETFRAFLKRANFAFWIRFECQYTTIFVCISMDFHYYHCSRSVCFRMLATFHLYACWRLRLFSHDIIEMRIW